MKNSIALLLVSALALALLPGCGEKKKPITRAPVQKKLPANPVRVAHEPSESTPPSVREISPGTIQFLDSKNGFRDLTFGQSDSAIPNLVLKTQDDGNQLKTYTRTGETMMLDGTLLKSVEYTFFKGQLSQVRIKWRADGTKIAATTSLAPTCAKLYGVPKKRTTRKEGNQYIWHGKQVELILNEAFDRGIPNQERTGWAIAPSTTGMMLIESLPLRKAMNLTLASASEQKKDGL